MNCFFHIRIRYRVVFMWENADDLRHQFPELLRSTGIVCKCGATRWRGEDAGKNFTFKEIMPFKPREVYMDINLVGGFNFFLMFFPWWKWSKLTISYFSDGLVQPPTRNLLGPMTINLLALDEYKDGHLGDCLLGRSPQWLSGWLFRTKKRSNRNPRCSIPWEPKTMKFAGFTPAIYGL